MTATRRPWLGDLLPELALAAAGFAGYLLVRWATLDRTPDAVANARDVLALEEALGLDREHAIQVATFTSTPWLGHAATLRRGSATTASPTPSARPLSRPSPVPRGS